MVGVGSVELAVNLSLKQLASDAKSAEALIRKVLNDIDVKVKVTPENPQNVGKKIRDGIGDQEVKVKVTPEDSRGVGREILDDIGEVEVKVTVTPEDASDVGRQIRNQIGDVEIPVSPSSGTPRAGRLPTGGGAPPPAAAPPPPPVAPGGRARGADGRFIGGGGGAGGGGAGGGGAGGGGTGANFVQGLGQGLGVGAVDLAAQSFQALSGAIVEVGNVSLQAAQDFDASTAAVNSLGADGEAVTGALRELSADLGGLASANDLAAASYDVLSARTSTLTAGLTDAEVATTILRSATKGAVGGFSTTAVVADALTSTLNAYGQSASEADAFTAKFIATQASGKITVDQYANQIGSVAPLAAQAGVELDELNGIIATATSQGVQVSSAFAGTRAAIAATIDPSAEAAAEAKRIGIAFDATALRTIGLEGILKQLNERGEDTPEVLTKLFGSVEALAAIAPSAGAGLASLSANIERSANALENGELETALDAVADSDTQKFTNAINLANNALLELGEGLLPVKSALAGLGSAILSGVVENSTAFDTISESAARFTQALEDNPEVVQKMVEVFTQLANILGGAVAASFDVVAGLLGSDSFGKYLDGVQLAVSNLQIAGSLLGEFFVALGPTIDTLFSAIFEFFNAVTGTVNLVLQAVEFAVEKIQAFGDAISDLPLVKQLLDARDAANEAGGAIANVADQNITPTITLPDLPDLSSLIVPPEEVAAGSNDGAQQSADDRLAILQREATETEATLLASGATQEEIRAQQFASEQAMLDERIAINRAKLAELNAALSGQSGAEAAQSQEEILGLEQSIADDRLSIQQGLAGERQRIEKEALDAVVRANQEAQDAIAQSQNVRIIAVREAQLAGTKGEEQAAAEIQKIQEDGVAQTLAAKEAELAGIEELVAQGRISEEEAGEQRRQLNQEIGQETLKILEQEIEARREAARVAIEEQYAPIQAAQQNQLNSIDLQSSAMQGEISLLNAQVGLQQALADMANGRLESEIAAAEASGDSRLANELKLELLQNQQEQLVAQQELERESMRLSQEQRTLDAERQKVLAEIAKTEAEIALTKAISAGASDQEIANLQRILGLRTQQVDMANEDITRNQVINESENQTLQAQQSTQQDQLNRTQIGQLQGMSEDGGLSREGRGRLRELQNADGRSVAEPTGSASAPRGAQPTAPTMAQAAVPNADKQQPLSTAIAPLADPALSNPSAIGNAISAAPAPQTQLGDPLLSAVQEILNMLPQLRNGGNTFNINGVENGQQAAREVATAQQRSCLTANGV